MKSVAVMLYPRRSRFRRSTVLLRYPLQRPMLRSPDPGGIEFRIPDFVRRFRVLVPCFLRVRKKFCVITTSK